ncbi:hypothetical protein [Flavobacterium hungaricum]|uniref:Uncharacterized protein n=1 Tax=Flavobacterium hungaricum TaxID=2082725 RepID=A0ABR9TRH2_9FLAO|nr:hypothetical protein [Flavobacterium hungaricum]MBE8727964.1 hypothetical protein [Flavobacterium hungaricum]
MTDYIDSFLSNYKSKIRNPFIGTMLSVWLIKHWDIVFAFFSFDAKRTMEWKINYVRKYFSEICFWPEFWKITGISLFSLMLTFILLGISRALTDFYYKIAEPYIVRQIDKKQIFTLENKKTLDKRIATLEAKLEKSIDAAIKAEGINEQLELKHINNISEMSKSLESATSSYAAVNNQYNLLLEKEKKIEDVYEQFRKLYKNFDTKTLELLKNINQNHRIDATYYSENYDVSIKKLGSLGMIRLDSTGYKYELTQLGIFFMNGVTSGIV